MRRDEDKLQEWCVTYLYRWYPKTIYHHSSNEGARSERQGWHLKRMGMLPGWPDLEILVDKRIVFVEFKTEKGRLSPAQKLVKTWMEAQGYTYFVCRSMDSFVQFCREHLGPEANPDKEALIRILRSQ